MSDTTNQTIEDLLDAWEHGHVTDLRDLLHTLADAVAAEHATEPDDPPAGVKTYVGMPEGAMVLTAVEVASYWTIGDDGDPVTRYGLRVAGDESYVNAYGMLEFAKMHLFTQHMDLG